MIISRSGMNVVQYSAVRYSAVQYSAVQLAMYFYAYLLVMVWLLSVAVSTAAFTDNAAT